MGDSVIVINAKGIYANPTRVKEKVYYRHSNYPGGLKAVTYTEQLTNHPDRIIKSAVKGMLPHNSYGRELMKRLRVFAGAEHPHTVRRLPRWILIYKRKSGDYRKICRDNIMKALDAVKKVQPVYA
jgi:large subunit ribosomal protein L13